MEVNEDFEHRPTANGGGAVDFELVLRDIHLPEVIGWWPPAMGWWILAVLIVLLGLASIYLYKRITQKTALKTSKKIFLKIKADTTLDDEGRLVELSALIRRVAISISSRAETASLTGQAWLEYLDSSVTGAPFTQGAGQCLADTHFQKTAATDCDMSALINLCENWLKAQKENKK